MSLPRLFLAAEQVCSGTPQIETLPSLPCSPIDSVVKAYEVGKF